MTPNEPVPTMANFLEPYDDIALEILDRDKPVAFLAGVMPPKVMVQRTCEMLKVDDFDLFVAHPFKEVYESNDMPRVLGYAFIAYLRQQVFETAKERNIGYMQFNDVSEAMADVWYRKLMDKWIAMRKGEDVNHNWWLH